MEYEEIRSRSRNGENTPEMVCAAIALNEWGMALRMALGEPHPMKWEDAAFRPSPLQLGEPVTVPVTALANDGSCSWEGSCIARQVVGTPYGLIVGHPEGTHHMVIRQFSDCLIKLPE